MAIINKYRIYCVTEATYVYGWYESEPTTCPNNTGHTITGTATAIVDILDTVGNYDSTGRLLVNTGGYTQMGEQRISMYDPIFQNYALYNIINRQVYDIFAENGGTVTGDVNGTELDINITSTVGSYAVIRSTRVCKYRPGYNITARFNSVYASPVANLLQFGGFGNNGSDLYFCYNGLNFGVRYSTGGLAEVRNLVVTAETSLLGLNRTATVVLNGVTFNVTLTSTLGGGGNASFTAYQISRGTFTGWNVVAVGNTVIFTSQDVGNKNGTYSYSSNGNSTGTFSLVRSGSALNTTFINRNDWNGPSSLVQTLNPLQRNMYSIVFTWYGSGNIDFKIFNPENSTYEVVHTLKFANLQTEPSLSQPNMYLQQGIASLGSTTARSIKIAGGFAAVEGLYKVNYPLYGLDSAKSIATNVETVILAIRNRDSVFGFTNNSEILIRQFSVACDGNRAVRIRLIKNPTTLSANTTTDFVNWQYVNETESFSVFDTTANTFTGTNEVIATYYLQKSSSQFIDLTGKEIYLFRGETILLTAFSTAVSDINCAVTIVEDY